MKIADCRLQIDGRLRSPVVGLAVGLFVALVLAVLPGRWTDAVRWPVATALRPGQTLALRLRKQSTRTTTSIKSHFQTTGRLADAQRRLADTERRLDRLRQENRRLADELAAVRAQTQRPGDEATDDTAERLLLAQCVRAYVLGRQARTFLGRHHLLDIGRNEGIEPDALVVDCPAVIDRGRDADLGPDRLVLSGRRVWGKIVRSGPNTSTVRAVTEPGYRDIVRLSGPHDPQGMGPQGMGSQGILDGTGEPLARIRLVEVTEPVAVGDPVYAAAGKGVLPVPLLYGRIVRLERPAGAAHWQIWMQPAVTEEPEQVGVLRMELNPVRVAGKASSTRSK